MTNNNSNEKFMVMNKSKLDNSEVSLECSINLETTETVDKVLSINVNAEKVVCESLIGEANFTGTAVVDLVYITTDGNIYTAMYTSPFSGKVQNQKINTNSKLCVKPLSLSGEVNSIYSQVAKVNLYMTFAGFVYNNEEVEYLANVDNDVCTKMEELSFVTLENETNSSWTENVYAEVKEPIKQVLYTNSEVYVKNIDMGTNYVAVSCELENDIAYLTDEENPKIKIVHTKNEVKQEVECEYATKEKTCDIDLSIQKSNVKTSIEQKDDDIKIALVIPLDVCIRVYKQETQTMIEDLYSTQKQTTITMSSFENQVPCEPINFDKKVEGSLVVDENEPRIDKLLAVNYSKAVITNEYIDNGTYNVSGVIQSNLIYFNEDEAKVCALDIEIPFAVSSQVDYDGTILLDTDIKVCDVDVMVKKGRDVYVDATLKVRSNVCKTTNGAVISELNYLEEYPQKDCAIEIYFAKAGENTWDIAKKLNIREEQLYNQNPDLKEILEKDEKLAIYYKLEK